MAALPSGQAIREALNEITKGGQQATWSQATQATVTNWLGYPTPDLPDITRITPWLLQVPSEQATAWVRQSNPRIVAFLNRHLRRAAITPVNQQPLRPLLAHIQGLQLHEHYANIQAFLENLYDELSRGTSPQNTTRKIEIRELSRELAEIHIRFNQVGKQHT